MKENAGSTKIKAAAMKTDDFRVWCAGCCIRISPHEEQIAREGETYHPRCYSKHLGPVLPLPAARVKRIRGD
jgi:hypothetical protein